MSATTVLCVRKGDQVRVACVSTGTVAPPESQLLTYRRLVRLSHTLTHTPTQVVVIGDGQVTQGAEVVKPNVRKVRRIGADVIGGFAGATADAFTLFERLETKLEEHPVRG